MDELANRGFSPQMIDPGKYLDLTTPDRLEGLFLFKPDLADEWLFGLFGVLQKAGPALRRAAVETGAVLVTVSRVDGMFGLNDSVAIDDPLSGLWPAWPDPPDSSGRKSESRLWMSGLKMRIWRLCLET
jgi:hypothetical protein